MIFVFLFYLFTDMFGNESVISFTQFLYGK